MIAFDGYWELMADIRHKHGHGMRAGPYANGHGAPTATPVRILGFL